MDKIIKTFTLLFFISGIGLFVAYSSGYFTVKKEGNTEQSKQLALVHDTIIQAEIDSLESVRLMRIFGSKSAVIEKTEYDVIDKRLSLLRDILEQRQSKKIHFSSSKSLSGSIPIEIGELGSLNLSLLQNDSLKLLAVKKNIIQAEIDSLKQRKFRMYSSKAIIIGAEKEHAAIDKRLQLLENILNQRQ